MATFTGLQFIFHNEFERGLLSFCKLCQKKPHPCRALELKPDALGCLTYYIQEKNSKQTVFFYAFTKSEFTRNRPYSNKEFDARYPRRAPK